MTLVDHGFSTFTTHELERLAAYKGAVAAGLYSDWDGSTEATDTEILAWVLAPTHASAVSYPFTTVELERLEKCRAAVAAGYYSEDGPS
jgi:roadblock/LC7 domain-containing protein